MVEESTGIGYQLDSYVCAWEGENAGSNQWLLLKSNRDILRKELLWGKDLILNLRITHFVY